MHWYCVSRGSLIFFTLSVNTLFRPLGSFPTCIFLSFYYTTSDAPTKNIYVSIYWIEHVALLYSLLILLVVSFLFQHHYLIVYPYYIVAWFLCYDQRRIVYPVVEVDDTPLSSLHYHQPVIKNMLVLHSITASIESSFKRSVLFSSCWCCLSCNTV